MPLSDEQVERYSRQIVLPEIGGRGQERLLESTVAVVGSGPVAWTTTSYLAGAGVGCIDVSSTGREAATDIVRWQDDIADLNPEIRLRITTVAGNPAEGNREWALPYDLVVSVCDHKILMSTTVLARQSRRPIVAGGVFGATGWFCVTGEQCAQDVCVACVERTAKSDSLDQDTSGPLAAVTGTVVGSLIAIEGTKRLLGLATPDGWFFYDARRATLARRAFTKQPDCPVCTANDRS